MSLQERLPRPENERHRVRPVFPTAKEQDRAREIILKGWDGIVRVTIECTPPEEVDPVPMSAMSRGSASQKVGGVLIQISTVSPSWRLRQEWWRRLSK